MATSNGSALDQYFNNFQTSVIISSMSKHLKTKERASEERKTNLWRPEVDVENNNSDRYAVENMSSEYADMLIF